MPVLGEYVGEYFDLYWSWSVSVVSCVLPGTVHEVS